MIRKNNSEDFLKRIFERSKDPIAQLEKINSIVPAFFMNEENVMYANKELDSYGYQINGDYIKKVKKHLQMMGHPSCGADNGYGSGHPSCGNSNDYGYGGGHPSCGSSNGYGTGHPSCCSSKSERNKSLLLIKKNSNGGYNEVRN